MSVITWETGVLPAVSRPATSPVAASRSTAAGLRLTRRGQLVVIALAIALAGAFTFSGQNASAGAGQEATEVVAYTVAAGDTLWAIAGSVAEPGQDRREVVDRIIAINGMSGSELRAGQLLILPAP